MPRPLAQFKPGKVVTLVCYKEGCESISLQATLGEKERVCPGFTGNGRFKFEEGTPVSCFRLLVPRFCPNCKNPFDHVVIVSNGRGKAPSIFGSDPEPA